MTEKKARLKIQVESENYAKTKIEDLFDAILKNKSKKEAKEILEDAITYGYKFAIEICREDNSRSGYDMVDVLENMDENGNSY